jgi:hypothetical protein
MVRGGGSGGKLRDALTLSAAPRQAPASVARVSAMRGCKMKVRTTWRKRAKAGTFQLGAREVRVGTVEIEKGPCPVGDFEAELGEVQPAEGVRPQSPTRWHAYKERPAATAQFGLCPAAPPFTSPGDMTRPVQRYPLCRVVVKMTGHAMNRLFPAGLLFALGACAGSALPPPNTVTARFDSHDQAVQVTVSDLAPPTAAALVSPDGTRYQATGLNVVSGPHVTYNPPPSIGIGVGGFGWTGCCSGIGSSMGVGLPVGGPTPASYSDQYVASGLIPVPADYAVNWPRYRVEVEVGHRALSIPAPTPPAE